MRPAQTRDWISTGCANCGRDEHWHGLCFPWFARVVFVGLPLLLAALILWAWFA